MKCFFFITYTKILIIIDIPLSILIHIISNMKCSYCLKDIVSGKYVIDYWGNYYHISHMDVVSKCTYCGRYISSHLTKGGKSYIDGTNICGICLKDVVEQKDLNREYSWISILMAKEGFDIRKYKTEIFLLDRSRNKNVTREEPGFINFKMKKIGGKIVDISFKVFIVKGLPREYFIETLAHELMHQWLILFAPDKMKPVLCEGSCNYISYLAMKKLKTPLSYVVIDRLLKDPHPHYGKGFRKVLSYSKKHGHSGLIKYIKYHKSI